MKLDAVMKYRCDGDTIPAGGFSPLTEKDDVVIPDKESQYYCLACGNPVTHENYSLEISGSSYHVHKNPAGIIYAILCFREAPGCIVAGPLTAEYSWFPGYLWNYALCSGCGTHLGWQYVAAGHDFFGLIANKLVKKSIG